MSAMLDADNMLYFKREDVSQVLLMLITDGHRLPSHISTRLAEINADVIS